MTVQLTEAEAGEAGSGCVETRKRNESRRRNYPEEKVKTIGRLFVISVISANRTNRAVFCEIVLERLGEITSQRIRCPANSKNFHVSSALTNE